MNSTANDGTGARGDAELVRLLQVVAVAANEARRLEPALQTCLDEVCAHTGWQVGHAYLLDRDTGELAPTTVWHLADEETFRAFRELTEATRFQRGEGLVGGVLESGQPEWVPDVTRFPRFKRGSADGALRVRAGMVFPILVGHEAVGVLEFYSTSAVGVDEPLLDVMAQVGIQIGRVVERIRADEALRSSEAKFAGIISISSDAVVSVDEAQRITFFNHGAEAIFGYTAEEIVGQHLEVLIPEQFRAGHDAHVRAFADGPVAARRMGERGQITGRRKNGEIFPADASISKLVLDGKYIFTAVLRDVTERVRAEEALAQQAEELARSNAELEQFAYVASHDLQEPLRMVASYTQLLARRYRDSLDADAEEFIGFAVDGVNRMQALINDLLSFSRVGTRGGTFEEAESGIVLDRVLSNLGPAIEETGAVVTIDQLPTVEVDAVQLGQLFQNLIGNAIKFHRPDVPPRVHVSASRGRDEWCFSVADNGIGIAPEYNERIFVLFQRLHSRTEHPGTGIGLAVCKKIVERRGGRIWVEPGREGGSVFHFTIPDAHRS